MADVIEMIQLSPTMEEGKLVAWLKNEGDKVATGDLIAEVETDKATMEMESFYDGVLLKILTPAGTAAKVGTRLAIIGKAGEDISALLGGGAAPATAAPAPTPAESSAPAATPAAAAPAPAATATNGGRILSSPLARKVASDLGVDITTVAGSGPAGRIVKRDVDAAATAKPAGTAAAPAASQAAAPARPLPVAAPAPGAGREIELSPMRKAIARNLSAAWQAPAFTITREINMDAAVALRAQINADLAATGSKLKLSLNDLVLRACALALVDVPEMNSAFQGDTLKLFEGVDIGVAVALDGGLITPVVRNAHLKSLAQIATEARELANRARDKKLKPDEYAGATFSVSNLGMFGVDHFTAVLNPPAAGILAVGAVVRKPVVLDNGTLGIGDRMSVTLTADHRAVDGAVGATWLQKLVAYLEHPTLLLV